MTRTLASIQRITDIQPIPDADAIEVASLLGWKVVVKKGEYQVGDLAVYLEIDSVPPDEEQYRFLWKFADQRPNNFRIRTIKLRGQISQGILFPLASERDAVTGRFLGWWLKDETNEFGVNWGYGRVSEGDDVTEWLQIEKYEAPLPAGSSNVEGQFFDGVPKTDEERVQSSTGAKHLAALQGRPYYITVKCDGSSMTVATHDGKAKVASRNYRLADTEDSAYYRAARKWNHNDPHSLLGVVELNPHLAFQGELCGPGIQNNRLGLHEHRCFVFNIYDRNEGRYLTLDEMQWLQIEYGFDLVPVLAMGDCFTDTQESLLALAEGKYEGTTNEREGIVIRSNTAPFTSFKAISNRYLLKGGE